MKQKYYAKKLIAYIIDMLTILSLTILLVKKILFLDYTPTFSTVFINWRFLMVIVVSDVIYLFVAALLLARYGCTLGMYAVGIRILRADGHNVTIMDGINRSKNILLYAGLNHPYLVLWSLVKYSLSWSKGEKPEKGTIKWDDELSVVSADNSVFAKGLLCFLTVGLVLISYVYIPSVKAASTEEEYINNYNKYILYSHISTNYRLDKNGKWLDLLPNQDTDEYLRYPKPIAEITDQKITFSSSTIQVNKKAPSYKKLSLAAVLAEIPDTSFVQRMEIKKLFDDNEYNSFSFTMNGVMVNYCINYSGYELVAGELVSKPDITTTFDYKLEIIIGGEKL